MPNILSLIPPEWLPGGFIAAGVLIVLLCLINLVLLLRRHSALRTDLAVLQRCLEIGQRTESEALRSNLAATERALTARAEETRTEAQAMLSQLTHQLIREQGEQRVLLEVKLREMGDHTAAGLSEIRRSVNERLTESIEKQMSGSFQRVIDQFAQVQKAMGDVQAVTAQIGDLKRIFTNVKTRGAWGEMQLRALLEDVLPASQWEANRKLRADRDEIVEFVLLMPSRAEPRPLLAVDAKFPAEDYDRLLLASEAGDLEGERAARRALEIRLRLEAKKIASKYIVQPVTVDFAVMYLPTDGLYVEAARMPGLIETLNREHRVLLMGPTLLPALIRTIQIGALTLSIEQRAQEIQKLLGAVRSEFGKMDGVLAKLEKQAGGFGNTITDARQRARAMERTLRGVDSLAAEDATPALQFEPAEITSPL